MFKCFKTQITTGFKFSLPPLVKTKGTVRLPKSHRAPVCFPGAGPSQHHLWKDMDLLMVPSQMDRASSCVGRADKHYSVSSYQNWVTKARAKRWASGKDLGNRWQGDCLRRGASASLPSSDSQLGREETQPTAQTPVVQGLRLPRSWGEETPD